MIAIARRSLTEPPGLKDSTFAYIVTCDGAMRLRRTTGVWPMVSRMLSWRMGRSPGGRGEQRSPRSVQDAGVARAPLSLVMGPGGQRVHGWGVDALSWPSGPAP